MFIFTKVILVVVFFVVGEVTVFFNIHSCDDRTKRGGIFENFGSMGRNIVRCGRDGSDDIVVLVEFEDRACCSEKR